MDWLPGARAAVLGRLWGALTREPIVGITDRTLAGGTLSVHFGQRVVSGVQSAAEPFAPPPAGFAVSLDGRRYDDPGALVRALDVGHAARFAAELDDSVANLALARAAQPAPDGGPPVISRPTPHAAYWEQLVVDGHPLHPGCRTRLGMSAAEVRRYAPEHRPVVDLVTAPVPPDRWLTTGAGLPPLLVLHPWQAERLGIHGASTPARPLMSLRTFAPLDDPRHHLKTAIDAQLTSAVRTVSEASVRNGPPVTAFLAGIQDGITILREPAAGIVRDDDGRPDRRRAMVLDGRRPHRARSRSPPWPRRAPPTDGRSPGRSSRPDTPATRSRTSPTSADCSAAPSTSRSTASGSRRTGRTCWSPSTVDARTGCTTATSAGSGSTRARPRSTD